MEQVVPGGCEASDFIGGSQERPSQEQVEARNRIKCFGYVWSTYKMVPNLEIK